MQQRRSGRQLIFAGVGIIVIVLALGLFLSNRGSSSSSSTSSNVAVVVATQAIPQGQTFQAGQDLSTFFSVQHEPSSVVPFGAYTSVAQIQNFMKSTICAPGTAPGCTGNVTASQTIYKNLPVVSGMFSSLGSYRLQAGPAFQIPSGYVAISVPFGGNNSVLGSINAGDDIDMMASYTGPEANGKTGVPTQTQFVLNDLRVIGVNGPPVAPTTSVTPTTSTNTAGTQQAASAGGQLLVLVRYQQALVVQHLKDFGGTWTISAVLRSSKETDIPHFRTVPVTARWFFVKQDNRFTLTSPY